MQNLQRAGSPGQLGNQSTQFPLVRAARRRRGSRVETMSAETASGPTEDQLEILEYNFNKVNKHPDPTTLCLIAAEAGLSEEETQKWFKQRLAQWRRSEGLPSECRSVTD
ncbi:Homeodomain-Only Protein [Manis pentadactyla]|nr:Homeodomain-Only Protein [Manis pentadactyla]